MARSRRVPFDNGGPFVASRYFSCNGTSYTPGKPFKADGLSRRRIQQLYDCRKIDMSTETVTDEPAVQPWEQVLVDEPIKDYDSMPKADVIAVAKELLGKTFTTKKAAIEALEGEA